MTKRDLISYYHRKARLLGAFLSSVPVGMTRDDDGRWLERAFWLSRLHKHLCKVMTHERAFEFVSKKLKERRLTEIDADLYDLMIEAGEKPLLVRKYRVRTYANASQFIYHLQIYREYHDQERDYEKTKFYNGSAQSAAWLG